MGKYDSLSNEELLLEKMRLEGEYEASKSKIIKLCTRLSEIDGEYNELIKKIENAS